MIVKIEIEIEPVCEDEFNAKELTADIVRGFAELTGYEVYTIETEEIEP